MPIPLNLPNFLNAPVQKPDYSGIENLPMKMLQAYMMPMQMQRQKEEHELKQLIGKAQANYYDKKAEDAGKESSSKVNNPLLQGYLAQEEAEKKWGKNSEQAKAIRAANQQTQGLQHVGEYENALQEAGMGYGGRNLNSEPAATKTKSYDRMNKELVKAEAMTEAVKTLDQIETLLKENPHLYKAIGPAFEEALESGGNPGIAKRMAAALSRNIGLVNPKDRIAAESISKLSNDLVSKIILAGNAGGGKVFTDMMKQILKSTKPDWTKSPEANQFIINKLRDELGWGSVYADELRTGLSKGFDVLPNAALNKKRYDYLNSRNEKLPPPSEFNQRDINNEKLRAEINNPNNPELNRMVRGIAPDGTEYHFPLREAEKFVRAGGQIID